MTKNIDNALKIKESLETLSKSRDDVARQDALGVIVDLGKKNSQLKDGFIDAFLRKNPRLYSLMGSNVWSDNWLKNRHAEYSSLNIRDLENICTKSLEEIVFRAFYFSDTAENLDNTLRPFEFIKLASQRFVMVLDFLNEAYGDLGSLTGCAKNFVNKKKKHSINKETELNKALMYFLNKIHVIRLQTRGLTTGNPRPMISRDGFFDKDDQMIVAKIHPIIKMLPEFSVDSADQWCKAVLALMQAESRSGDILNHTVGQMLVENIDIKKAGTTMSEDHRLRQHIRRRIKEGLQRYVK